MRLSLARCDDQVGGELVALALLSVELLRHLSLDSIRIKPTHHGLQEQEDVGLLSYQQVSLQRRHTGLELAT